LRTTGGGHGVLKGTTVSERKVDKAIAVPLEEAGVGVDLGFYEVGGLAYQVGLECAAQMDQRERLTGEPFDDNACCARSLVDQRTAPPPVPRAHEAREDALALERAARNPRVLLLMLHAGGNPGARAERGVIGTPEGGLMGLRSSPPTIQNDSGPPQGPAGAFQAT
jgi:hypothetical protein